jgi:hypothetical protein
VAAKDPDERAGIPRDPHNCVLGEYITAREGRRVLVHPDTDGRGDWWWSDTGERAQCLPEWANTLALRFDALTLAEATAKNVLGLLDGID